MSESYYSFEMFCSLLNNQNILKEMPALVVQGNLDSCVTEIKSVVLKDLLDLDNHKINFYLDLKINDIRKQDYIKDVGINRIQKWLDYFKIELEDVLEFDSDSDLFNDLVGSYYLNHKFEEVSDDKIENYKIAKEAQEDFLNYFLNYYANQLISFLESKKIIKNKTVLKKTKQFTNNQIVILLEQLGFFNLPVIKDLENTKQANILELISGLSNQNLRKNIGNLEKKPSQLTEQHKKDIVMIRSVLENIK